MFIEERHGEILGMLEKSGRISTAEVQERFGISCDSARRDLRILEEQGHLKRTYGGAIKLPQVNECPPRERDYLNMTVIPEYEAVAKAAVTFIKPNDVVYITSGSTGFLAARHLPKDFRFTLVLNSATLADSLKLSDNIDIYLTGGKMRMQGTANMVDAFATEFVKNMHFDLSLMTCGGIDPDFGVTNGTAETAEFQRAVLKNSRANIFMVPSGKLGLKQFIKVCDIDKVETLITDCGAAEDILAKFEERGVNVKTAPQN